MLDITEPAETITSDLVHDNAWAVEELTVVFVGYVVNSGDPC